MGKSLRVLMIEDSESDAALMARHLRLGGFEPRWTRVETAEQMNVALDSQEWDLVISDYVLPSFSGLDALRIAQRRSPDLPLIVVSGKVGEDTAVETLKAGACDYVMKDGLTRLAPAVERALSDVAQRRSQRESEESLRHSETLYRTMAETANEGIWQTDAELHTVFTNRRLAEMLGYERGEEATAELHGYLDAQAHKMADAEFGRPRAGLSGQAERPFRRRDGSDVWTIVSMAPLVNEQGSFTGVLSLLTDITERQRWEQKLAEHAKREAGIAAIGLRALGGIDMDTLAGEAVSLVADCLNVEFSTVLELDAEGKSLRLIAGVGWHEGLVGRATVGAGLDSQSGYTLHTDEPVVVDDLRTEKRFTIPKVLKDHGVVSAISVVIRGNGEPFGAMGAYTARHHRFTQEDVSFLQSVANVIASVVQRGHSTTLERGRDQSR